MAVSNEQLASYLASNPNFSDAQIAAAMTEYGVTPAQLASVTGISEGDVVSRIAKTLTPGQNINLGGVWVQPVYDSTGQGETFEQGQLKEVLVYNQNQQTGDTYKQYSPTGEYIKSGQFKDTGNFGDLLKDMGTAIGPIALMALTAGGAGGVLGSSLGLSGTAANIAGGALLGGGGAALTGQDVLTGALLGGAGGYFQGANAGFGPQTDASFLAADAAQLAGQGLSESTIAQILGASGYASGAAASLAASMAVNGLDVGMMTQQLEALSTNTGLMSQTGSSADFLAADALQLQDQLGNNFAAIEQNLIASGVDPLVAADVSNQLAFNGTITQDVLATNLADSFGDNIYDVNVAETYPTSTLPEEGGLLTDIVNSDVVNSDVVNTDVVNSDVVGTDLTTTTTTDTGGSTLGTTLGGLTTSQIAELLKAGVSLATILGASNVIGGGGAYTPMQTPTQGVPTNDPNYYNQLQQYYNAYLPQTPRDVVAPLQQWYEGSFGSTGTNTAVSPQQAQTAMPPAPSGTVMPTAPSGTVMPTAPVRPTTSTPVMPTPLPVSSTPVPAAASTGLFSTPMTAQQQVQNLLSSPNLSSLPPEAAAAISRAVSAPRSYNDVVASGGQNTVDVSSLSPEVQRAYDLYQQSMILGANSSEVRRAYERAGVNATNPDAFFAGQGLLTGTPTQAALSQYAPLALDRFAKSGGGALTYTVDPSTLPSTYTAPAVPDITFNMDRYVQSINNNTKISDAAKQRLISEQAVKRGFNPSEFI